MELSDHALTEDNTRNEIRYHFMSILSYMDYVQHWKIFVKLIEQNYISIGHSKSNYTLFRTWPVSCTMRNVCIYYSLKYFIERFCRPGYAEQFNWVCHEEGSSRKKGYLQEQLGTSENMFRTMEVFHLN